MTIIVIIILATAVILTLNKNNPIEEANKARYESDRDSMQAIFTNTVAKIMAKNQGNIDIKESELNEVKSGVQQAIGVASYTLENPENENNKNGTIIFDNGANTEVEYYTGIKLPIYKAGKTIWSVDSQGIINLRVGETIVDDNENNGNEEDKKEEGVTISKEEYSILLKKIEELEKKLDSNSNNQDITGIKTDIYIKNELNRLTEHYNITSMNGFTISMDQNSKMSEYVSYNNTNGYTILKSGWYFFILKATAYGDSKKTPSVCLDLMIDGKTVVTAGHEGLQGVHYSDNNSFSIYLKQGQKFYFVAHGSNEAYHRQQLGICHPMF